MLPEEKDEKSFEENLMHKLKRTQDEKVLEPEEYGSMLGGNSACLNKAILACQSVYREKAATTVLKISIGVFGVTLLCEPVPTGRAMKAIYVRLIIHLPSQRRQSVCSLISRSTLSSNVLIKRIIASRPPGRRFRLPSSLKLCRCTLVSLLFMSNGNVVSQGQASKQASNVVFVVPKAAPFCLAVCFYLLHFSAQSHQH
ncbi:hypothetical protein T11_2525 [Trichinella zimbabwensis]|uniref:Uncharacterized protein n=1 Tax=Trichinella zimbabwensis TaxID=268475 RepID=A0A0V1HEI7_9BILA|nr:hypothetical protein T11_2525 [Trichinella zimbabwensis]